MTDRERALVALLAECKERWSVFGREEECTDECHNSVAWHYRWMVNQLEAALALPERSDPTDSWVVPGPVFRWLLGEEGDFVDPSGTNRPYFWRKKLRDSAFKLCAPAAPAAEPSDLVNDFIELDHLLQRMRAILASKSDKR